ncbi:MAG: DUF4397 domain-containing protein [Niabella sp.]
MTNRNFNFAATIFLAFMIIFSGSCTKLDSNDPQPETVAYVGIVHASPNAGAIDIAFDQNRLNLNFFNYTDRVSYLRAFPGTRAFQVFKRGTYDTLVAKNIQLEIGKSYSAFVADTGKKMDVVLLRDSSRAPGADSIRIRFANMSPDAGNLNLYVTGNNNPIATNIGYKAASEFISMKAANNVTLEIKQTGQAASLAQTVSINLLNGYYYTIWSTGFKANTTENAMALQLESFWH